MTIKGKLLAGGSLATAAAWLPLTSYTLHLAVPRARGPSWTMPWPAYWYWREGWGVPVIRHWLLICGAGSGFALVVLLSALAWALWGKRGRRLMTAAPGQPVDEVPRARSRLYGTARWMTHKEAKRLSRRARHGCVVIGEADDGTLLTDDFTNGAGHGLVTTGSGGGKTSSVSAPTLVPDRGWCGPVLVFDPAGELSHMTRDVREAAGQRVVVLSPFSSDGFNALDWIDIHGPQAGMNIEGIVELIGKERPKNSSENPMWRISGKTIQEALLLHLLWDPAIPAADKNLPTLAEWVSQPEDDVRHLLREVHKSSASRKARILAGSLMEAHEKTFSGFHADARSDLKWLLEPAYARMVSGNTIRSDALATDDVSVYVEIPMDVLQSAPEVGRTVLHALIKGIYRHRGKVKNHILGIFEDVDLLGDLQVLREARDNARKYGFHMLKHRQAVGQIADTMGVGGKSSEVESSSWQIYIGIQNEHSAKEVAERCGSYTGLVANESRSSGRGNGGGNRGRSDGLSLVRVPLEHPADVQQYEGRYVFRAKRPPLKCGHPYWFNRPEMVGRVKDSPFREPGPPPQPRRGRRLWAALAARLRA